MDIPLLENEIKEKPIKVGQKMKMRMDRYDPKSLAVPCNVERIYIAHSPHSSNIEFYAKTSFIEKYSQRRLHCLFRPKKNKRVYNPFLSSFDEEEVNAYMEDLSEHLGTYEQENWRLTILE